MTEGIDLSKIDTVKGANEGFEVIIVHPATNVDLGIKIRVLGKDSDEFQRISRAQSNKRLQRMSKGFRNTSVPVEEIEQDSLNLLVACTMGWSGVVEQGEPVHFSKDNARMIYEKYPWIREQVDFAIGDRANFLPS